MSRRSSRRGYAMMLVLVFIALVLSFFSLSYRHIATALRVETTGTFTHQRDEGSLNALAAALARLETGTPPSSPYVCAVSIEDTPLGTRSYTVTFTEEDPNPENRIWRVRVEPTAPFTDPPEMPADFTSS